MEHRKIALAGREVDGYALPLGPVNLVWVVTREGLLGCGAFDVAALDRFQYPAARISGVSTIDELLAGTVKEANRAAEARGVRAGMGGREALEKL